MYSFRGEPTLFPGWCADKSYVMATSDFWLFIHASNLLPSLPTPVPLQLNCYSIHVNSQGTRQPHKLFWFNYHSRQGTRQPHKVFWLIIHVNFQGTRQPHKAFWLIIHVNFQGTRQPHKVFWLIIHVNSQGTRQPPKVFWLIIHVFRERDTT